MVFEKSPSPPLACIIRICSNLQMARAPSHLECPLHHGMDGLLDHATSRGGTFRQLAVGVTFAALCAIASLSLAFARELNVVLPIATATTLQRPTPFARPLLRVTHPSSHDAFGRMHLAVNDAVVQHEFAAAPMPRIAIPVAACQLAAWAAVSSGLLAFVFAMWVLVPRMRSSRCLEPRSDVFGLQIAVKLALKGLLCSMYAILIPFCRHR